MQEAARALIVTRARETRLEDPEDEVGPLAEYTRQFGDYRSNGLGHTWADWGDVQGVLVPGKRVWTVSWGLYLSSLPGWASVLCVFPPPVSFWEVLVL